MPQEILQAGAILSAYNERSANGTTKDGVYYGSLYKQLPAVSFAVVAIGTLLSCRQCSLPFPASMRQIR